jgi:hypothetical protein
MIRVPKLILVFSLLALLMLTSPASAQLGQPFSSPDGRTTFTGSMGQHVTGVVAGTEATLGAYTGTTEFDNETIGAMIIISNGTATLDFGGGDTLSFSYEGTVDVLSGFIITATWTVTGATGALTGAAGGGTLTGVVLFENPMDPSQATGSTTDLEGNI